MAELTANGMQTTATPGSTGQFDVLSDGELVFSKWETGRFPDDGEVRELLAGRA